MKVALHRLSVTANTKRLLESAYQKCEIPEIWFSLLDNNSQQNAATYLACLGLDWEAQDLLGNRWSIRWGCHHDSTQEESGVENPPKEETKAGRMQEHIEPEKRQEDKQTYHCVLYQW